MKTIYTMNIQYPEQTTPYFTERMYMDGFGATIPGIVVVDKGLL